MATFSRIAGTGSYLPERILTNADLEKIVDTSDEWIVSRSGIRERHVAADGETTSDLAYQASSEGIGSRRSCAPMKIELIIVGTTTPDIVFSVHRLSAAGQARYRRLRCVRCQCRMFRIHFRAEHSRSVHPGRKRSRMPWWSVRKP